MKLSRMQTQDPTLSFFQRRPGVCDNGAKGLRERTNRKGPQTYAKLVDKSKENG